MDTSDTPKTSLNILQETLIRLEHAAADIVINAHGVVTAWNPLATTLFGWVREEALGRQLADLVVPPELRIEHRLGLDRWRSAETALVVCKELHTLAIDKSGTRFPVIVNVQVIRDGAEIQFLGWVRLDTTA